MIQRENERRLGKVKSSCDKIDAKPRQGSKVMENFEIARIQSETNMCDSLCIALKEIMAEGKLHPSALLEFTVCSVNRRQKVVKPGHDVVAGVMPAH
jgi:hypothetical protein